MSPPPTEEKRIILCNKHNKTIVITGGWLTQNIIWNFQKRRLPSCSNSFKFKSFVCAAKMPCVFYRFVSKTTRIFWRDYIIIRTTARGEKKHTERILLYHRHCPRKQSTVHDPWEHYAAPSSVYIRLRVDFGSTYIPFYSFLRVHIYIYINKYIYIYYIHAYIYILIYMCSWQQL